MHEDGLEHSHPVRLTLGRVLEWGGSSPGHHKLVDSWGARRGEDKDDILFLVINAFPYDCILGCSTLNVF